MIHTVLNCISGWKMISCSGNDNGWWALIQKEKWTSWNGVGNGSQHNTVWSINVVLCQILRLWSSYWPSSDWINIALAEKKLYIFRLKFTSHRLQVSLLLFQEFGIHCSLNVDINCCTCNSVSFIQYLHTVLLNV